MPERDESKPQKKAFITNKLLQSFRQSKNSSRNRKQKSGDLHFEMNLIGQKARTNFLNVKIKTPGLLSSTSKQSIENEKSRKC